MWPWVYRYQKREVLATFVQLNSSSSQKKRENIMLCQFYTKLYIFLRLAEYFRTYTYSILCNNFNSWKKLVYTFLNPSMPYLYIKYATFS